MIELFAGIGSQTQALKNAGIEHESVAIAEIDKYALQAYELLHGSVLNLGDISTIDPNTAPDCNLITYSFPCQDLSVAGAQLGAEEGSGTRSSLLWECKKLIEAKKPRFLLMENVKNICENTRKLLEEKFGNIQFVEEGHEYFIEKEKYTPVSTIISEYEQPFDEDRVAENYARKNHRTKEDVLKEWKFKNLKSTIGGSRVHEFGESYTNMVAGFPEKICESNRKQYVDCRGEMVLVPTYAKEFSVKKFYDEKSNTSLCCADDDLRGECADID